LGYKNGNARGARAAPSGKKIGVPRLERKSERKRKKHLNFFREAFT